MHYNIIGRSNGQTDAPSIDEEWYSAAYPLAAIEVAEGKATGFRDHYHRIGRFRGYLPHNKAARPENPSDFRSHFGGLWTDQGNALDVVAGRLDLGFITSEQANLLTKWIIEGFVIIERAIPEDILSRATDDMNAAHEGRFPAVRFDIHEKGRHRPWTDEVQHGATKALDLHRFSDPVRDLIFAPKVLAFLHLLFERRVLATQSLGFWRGSAQEGHQDSAYVNYSLPMQFAASWIALEDVQPGAGELFYHVGSQRMAEHLYFGKFKGLADAERAGADQDQLTKQIGVHVSRIEEQAKGMSLETRVLHAKRGDVLFWAADLAHGGRPISLSQTRKSIVTHYCPAEVVPSYFESRPGTAVRSHKGVAFYSSTYYDNPMDPIDQVSGETGTRLD